MTQPRFGGGEGAGSSIIDILVGAVKLNSSQGGNTGKDPKPGDDVPPAAPGGASGKEPKK